MSQLLTLIPALTALSTNFIISSGPRVQLKPTTSAPASFSRRNASLYSTPSRVHGLPWSSVFTCEDKVTTAGNP